MTTEMAYTSRWDAIGPTVLEWLAIDIIAGAITGVLLWQAVSPSDPPCLAIALSLAFFNLMEYLQFLQARRLSDTLNFAVPLDPGDDDGSGYLGALVALCRQYLSSNRVSSRPGSGRGPFLGRIGAPVAAFELENYGLRLAIYRRHAQKSGPHAVIALGPVADGREPVAVKLLEDLRRELVRSEEKALPGKKA